MNQAKRRDNFLENLRKAQQAKAPAQGRAPVQEKPLEQMSHEELDEALREAKMAQIKAKSETLNAKVKAGAGVSERLSRRLDRLEAITPPPSGSPEARARMVEALDTLADLILEHGDEIDRDYRERVGRGEGHLPSLVAAKQAVWERTAEGRAALEALEALDALEERGGRGDT